MKLRKHISKLLALGILTNNIYFSSCANTEIPNRYETLEGEHITIDDSMEGELVEIEVFGNTVQDENNLGDIQSVGDLYIDKNGNPILDSQGREQYKIDIISNDLSLWSRGNITDWTVIGEVSLDSNRDNPEHPWLKTFPITNGANYIDKVRIEGDDTKYQIEKIIGLDENSTVINQELVYGSYLNQDLIFYGDKPTHIAVVFKPSSSFERVDNEDALGIKIYINDENIAMSSKEHKITILLPTQLQKIRDIADKLYWDNEKNRYIIEKNIWVDEFNSNDWRVDRITDTDNVVRFVKNLNDMNLSKEYDLNKSSYYHTICTIAKWVDVNLDFNILGHRFLTNNYLALNIPKDNLNSLDLNGLEEYLSTRDKKIHYIIKPEIIDTNLTSKLKMPTYNGKTHIYVDSENGISPTIKATVDRLPQIAKAAVEEAEINSSSVNISLARMYVNMLPESLYKDQLQEQLNQVFSSDMTLDRKTTTSNLDIYIKSENMLSISLDTNSVTFDGYSGAAPMELRDAVNITINSSLPYDLNAYMPTQISNSDGSESIPFNVFNIKESNETAYKQFVDTTNKVVLKADCMEGNNNEHSIDLKLDSNIAHTADIYKTVVRFEATQK